MRIVYLEIENFRGIKSLAWAPSPGMNCGVVSGISGWWRRVGWDRRHPLF
jgi:hypothetical protein